MQSLQDAVDGVAERTGFSGVVRVDRAGRTELATAYGLADRGHDRRRLEVDERAVTLGLTEHEVLGTDVTVNDVLGVDLGDRRRHRHGELEEAVERERVPIERRAKVERPRIFEDERRLAVELRQLEGTHDPARVARVQLAEELVLML